MIRKVYKVDPLCCPGWGEEMKVINLIDKYQEDVVENTLRHCGLWKEVGSWPQPQENKVAQGEPGYNYGYFEHVCI